MQILLLLFLVTYSQQPENAVSLGGHSFWMTQILEPYINNPSRVRGQYLPASCGLVVQFL